MMAFDGPVLIAVGARTMIAFALLTAALPAPVAPLAPPPAPGICWVRDVVAIEGGVRIYFSRKGGPGFVDTPTGLFRPGDAPVDPARPDEAGVDAKLGDRLGPQNSPEDGCSLEVVTRDGKIGVEAKAYFHPIGLPSEERVEFIVAR
jgi:hypothetical protein